MLIFSGLLASFVVLAPALSHKIAGGKAIILDTDIYSDVDDVGALAIANVLANCGLADLRGVMINTHSKYGALAANVINTHYGNGHVPIGAIRPLTNETFLDTWNYVGEFASKVANNWPRILQVAEETSTPLELYRGLLAEPANNNTTIISLGFLTNIAELLTSTSDAISDLDGAELISANVKELVVMGGQYPSGWEFNFGGADPESTDMVLQNWPKDVPITFSGVELGATIYTGRNLRQHAPRDSPVMAAYEWYVGRCSTTRESWDPLTTLYGILGLDSDSALGFENPFAYANDFGYNTIVAENGSNAWVNDTRTTNQHWLRLADGMTNTSVAWLLDQFLAHDPSGHDCTVLYRSDL